MLFIYIVNPNKRNFYSPNDQRMMQGKMIGANIIYRILNVIVVFIINILISRLMGVAGYGLLSLLIVNASIFNLVSSLGADAGISYNTAAGFIKGRDVIDNPKHFHIVQRGTQMPADASGNSQFHVG